MDKSNKGANDKQTKVALANQIPPNKAVSERHLPLVHRTAALVRHYVESAKYMLFIYALWRVYAQATLAPHCTERTICSANQEMTESQLVPGDAAIHPTV